MANHTKDNHHERLFRSTFEDPRDATGLIRSLLPLSVATRVDWSTLALESGAFVDKAPSRHTDLLFGARTVDDRPVLIYLLVEHQSSDEPLMGLRMLGYLVRALERYVKVHGKVHRVPVVLPLVVSHCEQPWRAPVEMLELYEAEVFQGALDPHLPSFRYIVDDLSAQTEEALARRALSEVAIVTLLALRHIRITRLFADFLARWAHLLRALSPAQLDAVLEYALQVGENTSEELGDVLHFHVSQRAGDMAMTAGERLREQGREQGRTLGMADMLLGLLRTKFADVPEQARNRVANAGPEDLARWGQRMLTARTLAEVFAGPDTQA